MAMLNFFALFSTKIKDEKSLTNFNYSVLSNQNKLHLQNGKI